jgi:hypothetical protein
MKRSKLVIQHVLSRETIVALPLSRDRAAPLLPAIYNVKR